MLKLKSIANADTSPLVALLLLVAGFLGLKDPVQFFLPGDIGIYFILAVLAAIIIFHLYIERKTSLIKPLPKQPNLFRPFQPPLEGGQTEPGVVWNRHDETERLTNQIINAGQSHVVVSGPSGAGKSKLVLQLVAPRLASSFLVRDYHEYHNILPMIISGFVGAAAFMAEQKRLLNKYEIFIANNACLVKKIFEPEFVNEKDNKGAIELWGDIRDFFSSLLSQKPDVCFIFDQSERYFTNVVNEIERDSQRVNGYEIFFFMKFIQLCRSIQSCRTVFIIRAEYLYDSLDFLETAASGGSESSRAISYFLCPGINSKSSPDGVGAIRDTFKQINIAAPHFQKFERMNRLDSRTGSNTFLTQLTGFLIEHYFSNDRNVKAMLISEKSRRLSLSYYFDHLLNDYLRLTRSEDAVDLLKLVLFTIAIENKSTGQSVGRQRIAALAHIPQETVADAVDFALGAKILLIENSNENEESYRFVHEIISDYIVEDERVATDPILKEEIRGLSENRIEIEPKIQAYGNLILDWYSKINIGLVAIWFFFAIGALKFKANVCDWMYPWFERYVSMSMQCSVVDKYYLPIYFMHVVWLTFIYHIDRDYLRYTLHTRRLRFMSATMPVVGAALAVIFSQSPTLFVVPVLGGGFMMGAVLMLGLYDKSFVGRAYRLHFGWGAFTIGNMALAGMTTFIAWLLFWDAAGEFWDQLGKVVLARFFPFEIGRETISVVVIYALNLLMIYFWFQIRRDQQSRLRFAALLALHDRTHLETR